MKNCRIRRAARIGLIVSALIALLRQQPCRADILPQFIQGSVLSAADGRPIPGAVITTTTGITFPTQNGSFTLKVPPDIFDLIASAPGFRSNMATGILAGPGRTATVMIRLAPASTITGMLRGRVTEAGGSSEGISGALVFTDLGAIAVTDADGKFSASSPGGTASVTVAAQGYSSKTVGGVSIPGASLTVRLSKSFDGFAGPVSGAVRDACTGQQLAGVNLSTSSGKLLQTTDAQYTIKVPPGRTTFAACGTGYQCGLQTARRGFLPFRTVLNFRLVPLDRGIGTISGLVTDAETGEPAAGARVATDTQDVTFTDIAGTYSLQASPCASLLIIEKQGYERLESAVLVGAGRTTELNAAIEPLTGCMASGTVRSLFTGLPVAGARVAAGSEAVTSDAAGFYSIGLPSCASTLSVCADGFFKTTKAVFSPSGAAVLAADISLIYCPSCSCSPAKAPAPSAGPF